MPIAEIFPLQNYQYALIDRLYFIEEFDRGEFSELKPIPLIPKGLEGDEKKLPLLVDFSVLPDQTLDKWEQKIRERYDEDRKVLFGALLRTTAGTRKAIAHLANLLIHRNIFIRKNSFLRYYDPRVFAHLAWIFEPQQLLSLLGPFTKWSYFHLDSWHIVEAETLPASGQKKILSSEQWQKIYRVGHINLVCQAFPVNSQTFVETAQKISTLLDRAKNRYQLQDEADLVQFAMCGMTIHPDFDSHPVIQAIFDHMKAEPDAVFEFEIQEITPQQWQEIRRQLEARGKHERQ